MKRLLMLFIIVILFTKVAGASDVGKVGSSISNELDGFKDSLPDDIVDFFPNEIWQGDFSKLSTEQISEASLFDLIIDYLFLGLNSTIKSFFSILIVLLIASIFNMLSDSLSSDLIKSSFSLTSALCTCFTILNVCKSLTELVSEYITALCKVMEAFVPIMTTMYIMSGSISSSAVSSTSMLLFIALIEEFLVAFMLPIIEICICFAVIKAFGGQLDFSGISKSLKNAFTGVTVFIMSIFLFVLSTKNVLSQSADSISIKTAKFAISNFIPIVGSSVNDALRTVTSSIAYIKNSCGVLGLVVLLLLILPIIIALLLNKLSFSIASGISKALGCSNETLVIDEGGSICGFLIAIVCCTCILFVFALTIFIKSSVVIA